VGGPARWFTVASSSEDVAGAHAWSQAHGVPMVVLGGGTNVVIADAGLDALVVAVQPRGLAVVEDRETLSVAAAAGEPWMRWWKRRWRAEVPAWNACRVSPG
jgi:UDP-N-acetylmuramate dehydrogenase